MRDLLTPRARQVIYDLLVLASTIFGCWQATEGNVTEFIGSVLVALVGFMARQNVTQDDA